MNKRLVFVTGLLMLFGFQGTALSQSGDTELEKVYSLRGVLELDQNSQATENKSLFTDRLPIARSFFQQPPLVPHPVQKYQITLNNNQCMFCHSWKTYQRAKATKISQTHFTDRDGNVRSTLAARRYFCKQCHVPQVDAQPLVENEFKPVDVLQ